MVKTGMGYPDPEEPKWQFGKGPKDRGKSRDKFQFSSDKKSPGFERPKDSKFADWSETELRNYLKFLDNPPKPEDLEERPEGGYRP